MIASEAEEPWLRRRRASLSGNVSYDRMSSVQVRANCCLYTRASMKADEQEIMKLFEAGDRALMAADVGELSRIFADDYIQCDEHGRSSSKQEVIDNLASGKVRYVSMVSTGRRVRILRDDVAIVNGSEDDEVEREGRRFPVRYVYLDVVMKREGQWKIVASQLAREK
jgi:uncharacterized protein (TIGR02246 family)